MSRPYTTSRKPYPALFAGCCQRCDNPIEAGQIVVPHRDGWTHQRCASGGDDE